MDLEKHIEFLKAARGEIEADIILKNGQIINVFTGESYKEDVVIYKDKIIGVGKGYSAKEVYDLSDKVLVPGFIEAHIHIESTFLNPVEFARTVAKHGTCVCICDPHEIANVMGIDGIELFIQLTENLPVHIYFMAPSCVPASDFETSGSKISKNDIEYLFDKYPQRFLGLGEVMNFPGAYLGHRDVLEKIWVARQKNLKIDGHAPLLKGKELNSYIFSGPTTEHECIFFEEALEKLRKGMHIFIREGSASRNLKSLHKLINIKTNNISLVTDDRHADELFFYGHLNYNLKKCIDLGIDPIDAIRLITINPAQHFNLNEHGAIAPGYYADIVVLDDLYNVKIYDVLLKGQWLSSYEKTFSKKINFKASPLNCREITLNDLKIYKKGEYIHIIEIIPGEIITKKIVEKPKCVESEVVSDVVRDILKIAVIERHKNTGNIGIGFVKGLKIKKGAVASTVAHDSHNLIVVGTNDEDMVLAANYLIKKGGGIIIIQDKKELAFLHLPIAGLMSDERAENVVKKLKNLDEVSKEISPLGNLLFMHLSFLALPVIPALKITDKGLFDAENFSFTSLFK